MKEYIDDGYNFEETDDEEEKELTFSSIGEAVGNVMDFATQFRIMHEKANRSIIESNREEITAQYGEHTDEEILDIELARREIKECAECKRHYLHKHCSDKNHEYTIISETGEISKKPCEFWRKQTILDGAEEAHLPKIFHGLTLQNYQADGATLNRIKQARRALQNKQNLILHGNVGTGKTMLACILVQEMIIDHYVFFITLPKIMLNKDIMSKEEWRDFLQKLSRVQVLILDDLGAEGHSPISDTLLFEIVNERYTNKRQTIVTTNLPVNADCESLTLRRIFSRLAFNSYELTLNGTDKRRSTI